MKNKKGFTLIELLAVIVILAIIALIATPIILNMIESAKKSAAKDSAYGYIEAIETYQAYEMLKGNTGLKEGIYNIVEETTIDGTKYKKLTELIKVKGSNPTGGKIGITENGTVGTATMCVNDYVVEYMNNKAEIISEDCGEMEAIVTYNISSEEWETKKTLEILYPEGKYEYYYKLESGKATVGEKDLVVGEEIETKTNSVTIELLENSKVTAWMMKNGKTISTRTYEETKIDNIIPIEPNATAVSGYPIMTSHGVVSNVELEITNSNEQQGTSAYYSIDNGVNWTKYTNKIGIDASSIKVKMVRDESKIETESKDVTITTGSITNALGKKGCNGDESDYTIVGRGATVYINIDSSMYGKKIYVKTNNNYVYYTPLDKDGNTTASQVQGPTNGVLMTVPNDTTKLKIYVSASSSDTNFYEIKPVIE